MSKINEYIKMGSLIFVLLTIGVFYRRYDDKLIKESKERNDDAIREYLLTDPDTLGAVAVTRPILWIPIVYSYNSRKWSSFGSRSSYDLNQPYIYLVVKSIIKYCKDKFHICLVDDNSYKKLMPDWTYTPLQTPEPVMDYARKLAVVKLLRRYGGMTVPPSFLCMKDLHGIFEQSINNNTKMFVSEEINKTCANSDEYISGISVMGCVQESSAMKELEVFLETKIRNDHTRDLEITGEISSFCNKLVNEDKCSRVNAELLGIRDKNGAKVMAN